MSIKAFGSVYSPPPKNNRRLAPIRNASTAPPMVSICANAVTPTRKQPFQSCLQQSESRNELYKMIHGEHGPPMTGVMTHRYTRTQSLYRDDFEQLVSRMSDHPYINITAHSNQIDSSPHNLLTGTAYCASAPLQTESGRSYIHKHWSGPVNARISGVRCEQTRCTLFALCATYSAFMIESCNSRLTRRPTFDCLSSTQSLVETSALSSTSRTRFAASSSSTYLIRSSTY